jgi:phosphatidylserine/phosphatidylglycerophosphate/cardiolipin synthase-like enzyme
MTVKILATGLDFMQDGVFGTAPMIESIMKDAKKSLHILAYVISSDAENFLTELERAIIKKIPTVLVIDNLQHQNQEVIKKLEYWNKTEKKFKLIDFNRKNKVQISSKYSGSCSKCGKSYNQNELIFFQQKNSQENIPQLICKDKKCFMSNNGNMFPKKILHAKVIVSDRDKAVVGSANFSWGGMTSHYEVGVYVDGDEAETLAKMIESVADSKEN